MIASARFRLFASSLVIAFAIQSGIAGAAALPDSDRMVVTDPTTGAVLFDASTLDLPPGEASLTVGAPLPVPLPPGTFAVVLTEPAFDPLEGIPPLYLPGTNVIVSDLVISTFGNAAIPFGVTLLSDADPQLPQVLAAVLAGGTYVAVAETGVLQDISGSLGLPAGGQRVQVQSDVTPVPEPGTLVLLGCGLAAVAAIRSRRLRA